MVVPTFLNARPSGISSSHDNARPGGEVVFEAMLYTLARFEMDNGEHGRVTQDVQRAAWNAMIIFCETRRLRSILVENYHRIQYNSQPYSLTKDHWSLIRKWGQFSKIVQEERETREREEEGGSLVLTKPLPDWCSRNHQKTTFGCLVGVNGELLTLKLDPSSVGMTPEEFEQSWLQAGGNIAEPGFVVQL